MASKKISGSSMEAAEARKSAALLPRNSKFSTDEELRFFPVDEALLLLECVELLLVAEVEEEE